MIQPSQVWLAIEPVDMRLGIDGLSLRVQQALGRAPCDGAAIAFSNRRRDRMKLLAWDGTGVWLAQRRLHRGRFVWPDSADAVRRISPAQWRGLVLGIDWQRLDLPAPAHWQL